MTIPRHNNFDHLRLFLAIGVLLFHLAELSQLSELAFFKTYINVTAAVHAFFIVSGFLIFMSFERSASLKSYFSKRMRRIAPAYIAVVVTLFLGLSLLSSLSISEYFSSGNSWSYLLANLSTLNFLHPSLPGVFNENYLNAVDGSLWTIKVEVAFYLSVPLIAFFYRWFKPVQMLIAIFALSTLYFYTLGFLSLHYANNNFQILQHQLPGQMLFFSGGALLYYCFDIFTKLRHKLFLFAIIIYASQSFLTIYPLYAFALSVIVIYLATVLPYLGNIAKYGDLSYGIYIWHFPLIQVFVALGLFSVNLWLGVVGLIIAVFTLAWLSWHFVEKPFLSKKSHYVEEETTSIG